MNIIEAVKQVGDGGFSSTSRADKRDFLTGFRIEGDVVEDDFIIGVAEVDIVKVDFSLKPCVADRAIFMWMFPCPFSGALFCFNRIVILIFFGVDKFNITFICLCFFVAEFKDSIRAC